MAGAVRPPLCLGIVAITAITFLTALTSSAALGLPGALMQPLNREFGWDAEQISSALAVCFVLFCLMGPFAAILMERFSLRNVICVALGLIAASRHRAAHGEAGRRHVWPGAGGHGAWLDLRRPPAGRFRGPAQPA